MFSDVEMQLAYKLGNANINLFPYPHIYVENIFPADYYKHIQENLPRPEEMLPIEDVRPVKGYKERFVLELRDEHLAPLPQSKQQFWKELQHMMVENTNFGSLVFSKFEPFIAKRFEGESNLEFFSETLLVEDTTNYALGPHTDSPRKVITMLFYLPPDTSQSHLGTSIYIPNNPAFRCAGGPHHPREHFSRLHTNPFVPNSLFAFFKTDNSFHGVEPVMDPDTRRWLLLFDIYVKQGGQPQVQAAPAAATTAAPKVNFTF
jgi:hypothetical protein